VTAQALYNRWRGQTFADILGQDHITTTLRNQIRTGRIGHAYLFTGLRGTGKTSTARIMAKAVNCIGDTAEPPCNECSVCRSITEGRSLDLIEVDGASNRGIDEVRELRDRVAFAPSESRYKVYVIDEVHMLTNEAFNALLKTLEEPPAHVIFILCTTDPGKLPETVLSRCQRFDFRRGSVAVLMDKLRRICEHEGIAIESAALEFIARRATGSFRDAESLLDQLAASGAGEITLEQVRSILGSVSDELVADLAESLVAGDVPTGLRLINEAIDSGAEPRQFLGEVLDYLRAVMLVQTGADGDLLNVGPEARARIEGLLEKHTPSVGMLLRALRLFNEAGQGLRAALRAQLPLELAFVEAATQPVPAPAMPSAASEPTQRRPFRTSRPPAPVREPAADEPEETAPVTTPAAAPGPEPMRPAVANVEPVVLDPPPQPPAEAPAEPEGGAGLTLEWVQGYWPQVLTKMRALSPQVQALLKSAEPVRVEGDLITLNCEAPFHRDKLSEEKKRELVEQVLAQVLGRACRVTCVVGSPAPRATTAAPPHGEPAAGADLFSLRVERGGASTQGERDSGRGSVRDTLLNHPAVKELQRRGGRVSSVRVYGEDADEEDKERG
jgi:DNA polymerase-3 subunit gamma/tau